MILQRRSLYTAVLAALISAAAVSAEAQAPPVSFSLDSAEMSSTVPDEVFFTGTLTNNTNADLYLNSIQFTFDTFGASYLSGDDDPFYTYVTYPLSATGNDATYTGVIFGVQLSSLTPTAGDPTYTGSVTLLGGSTETDLETLNSQNFRITALSEPAQAAPEPSSVAAFAFTGLFAAGLVLRARKRRGIIAA